MLPELLDSRAFTFNDLSSVEKFRRLDLEKGITPENKDLILALKMDDNFAVPASLMKLTHKTYQTIESSQRMVLGVFAEKDGNLKTVSVNRDFVKDEGKQMLDILRKSRTVEPFKDEPKLPKIKGVKEMPQQYPYVTITLDKEKNQASFHYNWAVGEEEVSKINLYHHISDTKVVFEAVLKDYPEAIQDKVVEINDPHLTDNLLLKAPLTFSEALLTVHARSEELERDSDGDGIPDVVEKNQGTNPFSPDTDGDGKSDQEEVSFGSNPLDKESPGVPSEVTKTVSELIAAKDNKGLAQVLKEGVKEYFSSDTYKTYLETMSKFHQYSPRNIQLIMQQNPNATQVASFKKWKDEFGRSVNKGEKALRIFAPMTLTVRDPKTKEPLLDKDGKEQTYTSYKLVPVFDVSQTNGKELAKPIYELEGTYEDYGNLYKAAREVSEANGVPLSFSKNANNANGYYSPMTNEIVIKSGMSEQQTLKTIFHEMAHSDLHNVEKLEGISLKRSTAELQAESVAFVVASHYGLDTSEYSFGYLANWSEDPSGLSDLEAQIKIVQKEANSLIGRIDKTLEKYKSKDLTKDAFQEKLDRLKNKDTVEKEQVKEPTKKAQKSDQEMNL